MSVLETHGSRQRKNHAAGKPDLRLPNFGFPDSEIRSRLRSLLRMVAWNAARRGASRIPGSDIQDPAIGLAFALFYILEHTPLGRKFYAVGGSERVAFLAGIRTGHIKVLAFAAAGFLVGIGAMFELGQSGAASAGFGPDLLLPAYAAAFLGVTTYRPGYFNIPGAMVAIILLAVGFNGLNLLGAPFWVRPIFNGVVLVLAVITARAEARQLKK
jgi:ABC-type glucose/galactose transport system permease subunit